MALLNKEVLAFSEDTYEDYIRVGEELSLDEDSIFPVSKEEYERLHDLVNNSYSL